MKTVIELRNICKIFDFASMPPKKGVKKGSSLLLTFPYHDIINLKQPFPKSSHISTCHSFLFIVLPEFRGK